MTIKVGKYIRTPSGKKLKNKFIVYDDDSGRHLSSITGTSRTSAYRLAKMLKTFQKLEGKTVKELQKKIKSKSKDWELALGALDAKRHKSLAKWGR